MTFHFVDQSDISPLDQVMADLSASGRGWINLMPEGVERIELGATRSIPGVTFGRLSGRGAPIPKVTWTAPEVKRRRTEPAHLGIEHPAGPKARQQLAEAGHPVPPTWRVLQDHALRGLVVVPLGPGGPDDIPDHGSVLRWALKAATILADGKHDSSWQAQVFDR